MSKLIATFPTDPPNAARAKLRIYISTAGVEIQSDIEHGLTTLDPIEARTLATLLMHASNEAEMMKMRAAMEEEHERTKEEVGKIASLVKPTP